MICVGLASGDVALPVRGLRGGLYFLLSHRVVVSCAFISCYGCAVWAPTGDSRVSFVSGGALKCAASVGRGTVHAHFNVRRAGECVLVVCVLGGVSFSPDGLN